MFLNEYPDGTVRKRKRHLHGHDYPSRRVSTQKKSHRDAASVLLSIPSDEEAENLQIVAPEDASLDNISDDEY